MVWRVARTYLRPLLTMMGVDRSYSNSCQIPDHPRREIKVGMQIQKKITHVRMIILTSDSEVAVPKPFKRLVW